MNKTLLETQARQGLLKGVTLLESVVGITMGARGKNVVIMKDNAHPFITKDGITVAEYVNSEDKEEQAGINLVREASRAANTIAGDGSTASIVLAYNLLEKGIESLKDERLSPVFLKRGIDKAMNVVLKRLDELAINDFNVNDVAKISANGDEELATIITEAFDMVGVDGIIRIDESDTNKTKISREEGCKFDNGMMHPIFITDPSKGIAEYNNSLLLLVDGDIMEGKWLVPYFNAAQIKEKPLVIIANDFGENILGMCNVAKQKNNVNTLLIRSPLYGENRTLLMNDIAVMTGAKIVSDKNANITRLGIAQRSMRDKGNKMSDLEFFTNSTEKILGLLNKVHSERNSSTLYYDIDNDYIDNLKGLLKTDDDFAKERIAYLTGGVAVINVGGESSTEVREVMDRVQDAINATRAALEEGIVAGGGIALLEARKAIQRLELTEASEIVGADILYATLDKTNQRILKNADAENVKIGKYPSGYDVNKMKYVDMIEAGIIDPTKVIKESLRNSISVAGTILSTGAMVIYDTK